VELTLALEGALGIHELESQALAGGEGGLVDGTKAAVAEKVEEEEHRKTL
jgi:hypothetical protein